MDDNDELCERYKCGKTAVGTDGSGWLACYYHESKESYLARTRSLVEDRNIPSTVSPNDSTWRNP